MSVEHDDAAALAEAYRLLQSIAARDDEPDDNSTIDDERAADAA